MKINFKKVATVLGSALMLGSTAAFAAAASFTPSSFSDGGIALVVGQKAASSDLKAAIDLTANLAPATTAATTSTTTVTGGDSVKIEGSTKFGLGDQANNVLTTSINSDKMPNLLADGTYSDKDNTEYKYTQKIKLSNNIKLNHFSDSNYKDKTPTIGINLTSDAAVLNYTLAFDTYPDFTSDALETTTITLMGKEYYVLDVQNTSNDWKMTLLDSANSAVISEGESSTLNIGSDSYDVSIAYVSSDKVKLTVNGETTNSLVSGGTYKLKSGAYVGIKDIMYNSKDSGVSKAEISIGKGKLELEDGQEVQLNDDTVNGVTADLVNSSNKLTGITLVWSVDGEGYVTPDSSLTLPGFESVKISMADFYAPKSEVTTVKNSGSDVVELDTVIKSGEASIPLVAIASDGANYTILGKDSNNKLAVGNGTIIPFNYNNGDRFFIASWSSTTEAETYYLKAKIVQEDNVDKVQITNVLDSSDSKTVSSGNEAVFGNVVIQVSATNYSARTVNLTAGNGVAFNTIYTKEGLQLAIPTVGANTSTAVLQFAEADKDHNIAAASNGKFNLTLGRNSDGKVEVITVQGTDGTGLEIGDSENYESYVVSDLATKVVRHTSDDQDWAEVTYAGGQSYANAFVTAPQATVTGGTSTPSTNVGVMTVYDNEISSASGKNLIVIGGSCVNTVAAELLGGALCGDAFTAKTGIKSGEALIESFARSGKTALLVAGFNAEDTTKAVTYLSNNNVNTTVGSKLKVTSATTATAITA